MIPHGRGRGIRRVQDIDRPVGLVRSNLDQRAQEPGGPEDRFREDPEDAKSRSEDSPIPPNLSIEDLLQLIESGQDMRMITKCIKYLCSSEQALGQVVEQIHKISSKDKIFARNAAKAFSHVSQLEVCGVKFRDVVLRCIQNDYKNREEIASKGEEGYLLVVNLLCEVFHHVRLADGTVINVLSVPILEYFSTLLLNPTHEAIDLIVSQTHVIGEEVQRSKPEKFADFLIKIRKLISDPGLDLNRKDRCGLLHILESHLLRWPTVMPEKTGDFYASILGEKIRTRVNNLPTPTTQTRPNSQEGSQHEDESSRQFPGNSGARRIAQAEPIPRSQAVFRPQPNPGPVPRIFDTPPPNMLQSFGPPQGLPPPQQSWNSQMNPVRELRQSYLESPPLNGVERLAADMMAIRLPTAAAQASPPLGAVRNHGWQTMPPVLAPSGPPPHIPTAIVSPGVPPHNRPLGGYRDPRPRPQSPNWSGLPPSLPSANVPPIPQPPVNREPYQGRPSGREQFDGFNRPVGSGRIISSGTSGNQWSQPEPNPEQQYSKPNRYTGGEQNQRQEFDIGTWENPGNGGGGGGSDGDGSKSGGGGGGGRSTWSTNDGSNSRGEEEEVRGSQNQWSSMGAPDSGSQSKWSSGGVPDTGSQSKWSSGGVPDTGTQSQWSSGGVPDTGTQSQWSRGSVPDTGSQSNWSSGGVPDSGSQTKWGNGGVTDRGPQHNWSEAPSDSRSNQNQWKDQQAESSQWSEGQQNNKRSNGGAQQEPEIGHWGGAGDTVTTPDKKDWRNDSTDSASPAWKHEPEPLGNWADLVPSPRSDLEDSPLNTALDGRRKIVW